MYTNELPEEMEKKLEEVLQKGERIRGEQSELNYVTCVQPQQ